MEMLVYTVGMRADGQWQESRLKELNPCQYLALEYHLVHRGITES